MDRKLNSKTMGIFIAVLSLKNIPLNAQQIQQTPECLADWATDKSAKCDEYGHLDRQPCPEDPWSFVKFDISSVDAVQTICFISYNQTVCKHPFQIPDCQCIEIKMGSTNFIIEDPNFHLKTEDEEEKTNLSASSSCLPLTYSCFPGFYGPKCDMRCPKICAARECHPLTGKCYVEALDQLPVPAIFLGGITAFMTIMSLNMLCRLNRYLKKAGRSRRVFSLEESKTSLDTEEMTDSEDSSQLKKEDDLKSNLLLEEINAKEIFVQSVALDPFNAARNRNLSYVPYDHNRVILKGGIYSMGSDYINASYVKDSSSLITTIAAQGPLENTVDDFWQMIWQENTTQIVMLTNVIENKERVCAQYWPSTGSSDIYGDVTVMALTETVRADFIIRTFSLENKSMREVVHYQFVGWPEKGMPSAASFVNFWQYILRQRNSTTPTLVHCSDGDGRTGMFIALDIAMASVYGKGIDVARIITDINECRANTIRTTDQFKYICDVVCEACFSRFTRRKLKDFDIDFFKTIDVERPNGVIDEEFQMLQDLRIQNPKSQYSIAAKYDDYMEIRNESAPPDDRFLVVLTDVYPGRKQYICAVRLSSFRHHDGIIVTQMPTPNTLIDFWRLVISKEVSLIVSLGSQDEKIHVTRYCQFWPTFEEMQKTAGPFVIQTNSDAELDDNLNLIELSVKLNQDTFAVNVLRFTNWSELIPESEELIQLMGVIASSRSSDDVTPILVQCIDGVSKSGLFCACWEIFERVTDDKEIDVFLAASRIQKVIKYSITNEIQYRFCYKFAQEVPLIE